MPNDLAKLQGAWTLSALEMDGREMPVSGGISIDGDRFKVVGMGAEYAGKVEIDAAAKPKRFDLVFTEGPEAGNRNLGIYELKGDTWRLCLNMTGKARPTAFVAKPGSGNALEVFKRGGAPAEEDPGVVDIKASGDFELAGEWEMVAAFQGGHALDAATVKTGRRIASATHTMTLFGKQVFMKATYSADPVQRPKTIDLIHIAGSKKGKTELGIYELEGGILRLCFTGPGQPRPSDFESKPGDGRTLAVWRLVKP